MDVEIQELFFTPSSSRDFTDAQHHEQDEDVNKAALRFFGEKQRLSELECAGLLACIIKSSQGKLQAAFSDINKAFELVCDNPGLASELNNAWETKNYKKIRESELLIVPEPIPMVQESLTPSSSENFTKEQHEEQDKEVTDAVQRLFAGKQQLSEVDCVILLQYIIKYSEDKAAFSGFGKALELIRNNPKLLSALRRAWGKKNYTEIRESKLLTVPKPNDESAEQKKATENAWVAKYRGEALVALWTRIKKAMKEVNRYARYLAIVQSSGTGKSRMIEELSNKHLVIPVNLREYGETGYPPPDKKARIYLTKMNDELEVRVRAVAFLRAVFNETSEFITKLRESLPVGQVYHGQIVESFSKHMSEGMMYDSHGDKRLSFYANVDSRAKELEADIRQAFAQSNRSIDGLLTCVGLREAFKELIDTLTGHTIPNRYRTDPEPLVILAFDESRTLTKTYNDTWPHFSELCRALRALNNELLFSLFLTTTGNVNALVPSSRNDPSSRIHHRRSLFSCSPFTRVGFDHFACRDQFDFLEVVTDRHISQFGRPLWATRYDNGDPSIKSEIIQFAAHKLRAGKTYPGDQLEPNEKLACLAQRLPIEFHSVTYASKVDELQLVEGHMRILLRLDTGIESLTTVSASEPLLSEAAYWMMVTDPKFNAAETLKSCLESYAIHKGDRGEILVMLLFTLARDRAIGPADNYGRPRQRWCSVPDFMNALFVYHPHLKPLFAGSKIFFNHWVKVHQHAIVNVEYLAQLMRRGAALLFGANQAGIDGIIPFLLNGYTIHPNDIGVILWQAKNDSNFTDQPEPKLFQAMDPFVLNVLNPETKIPIIRIIFALASPTPCFRRVKLKQDSFKSCDFWVGGISPTVFSPVGRDESIWMALLQATYGWEDIYKENSDGEADDVGEGLGRSMNPGTAKDGHHWENWADFIALHSSKENKKDANEETDESMDED